MNVTVTMSPFAVGVVPVLTKISPARSVELVTMETEGDVPAPVPAAMVGAEDLPLMCEVVSVSSVDIAVEEIVLANVTALVSESMDMAEVPE